MASSADANGLGLGSSSASARAPRPSSGLATPDRLRPSTAGTPRTSSPASSSAPLILRIKRKRDAEPVDALMIDALLASAGAGGQKEGAESKDAPAPSDSAAAQDMPKRALKKRLTERFEPEGRNADGSPSESRGVFRLAETVSIASFNDPAATLELQRRMAHRAPRHSAPGSSTRSAASPGRTSVPSESPSSASKGPSAALEFRLVRPTLLPNTVSIAPKSSTSSGASSNFSPSPAPSPSGSASLRAPKTRAGNPRLADRMLRSQSSSGSLKRRALKQPPQIGRARKTITPTMRIIDAVAVSSGLSSGQDMEPKKKKRSERKPKAKPAAAPDADMEMLDQRFADLLGDYLKEKNLEPPSDLRGSGTLPGGSLAPDSDEESSDGGEEDEDSESEYVYDVYYRDRSYAAGWGSGPGGAAEVGLRPSTVAGHDEDMTSSQSSLSRGTKALLHDQSSGKLGGEAVPAEIQHVQPEPMARIVGLSASDLLLLRTYQDEDDASWDRLLSEDHLDDADFSSRVNGSSLAGVGKGSDEDWDEGEDEDSNDESFYRNDYPERDVDEEDGEGVEGSSDEDEEDDEVLQGWNTWRGGKVRGRGKVVIDSDDDEDD